MEIGKGEMEVVSSSLEALFAVGMGDILTNTLSTSASNSSDNSQYTIILSLHW